MLQREIFEELFDPISRILGEAHHDELGRLHQIYGASRLLQETLMESIKTVPCMSLLTTTASEPSQGETDKRPSFRSRRRLHSSVSVAAKRSRLVSPPRNAADANAHPFRQQHPGWPSLRDLPEASWTHTSFRPPAVFALLAEQDTRPPALLAAKVYSRQHISSLLPHISNYYPGENSQIFHGALKAVIRDHLRSEFSRVGSFEYRKIAGYEEVLLRMAGIYWILFGLWPPKLQKRHVYSLPTWLTFMMPCYYEWRNASGRWSPKSKMPQAPSPRRFFSQYPESAQMRWPLGRDSDCALFLNVKALTEQHFELPIIRHLMSLRQTVRLPPSTLAPFPGVPSSTVLHTVCPEVTEYLNLIGFDLLSLNNANPPAIEHHEQMLCTIKALSSAKFEGLDAHFEHSALRIAIKTLQEAIKQVLDLLGPSSDIERPHPGDCSDEHHHILRILLHGAPSNTSSPAPLSSSSLSRSSTTVTSLPRHVAHPEIDFSDKRI